MLLRVAAELVRLGVIERRDEKAPLLGSRHSTSLRYRPARAGGRPARSRSCFARFHRQLWHGSGARWPGEPGSEKFAVICRVQPMRKGSEQYPLSFIGPLWIVPS